MPPPLPSCHRFDSLEGEDEVISEEDRTNARLLGRRESDRASEDKNILSEWKPCIIDALSINYVGPDLCVHVRRLHLSSSESRFAYSQMVFFGYVFKTLVPDGVFLATYSKPLFPTVFFAMCSKPLCFIGVAIRRSGWLILSWTLRSAYSGVP